MNLTRQNLARRAFLKLSGGLGDCHLTIEVESTAEHCEDDCEHPRQ